MKKIFFMLLALGLFAFVSCKQEVEVSIPEDGFGYWTHDTEFAYVAVLGYDEEILSIGYYKFNYNEGDTIEDVMKKGNPELMVKGPAERSGNTFKSEKLITMNDGTPTSGTLSITLTNNGNSANYKYTKGSYTEEKNGLEKFTFPSARK